MATTWRVRCPNCGAKTVFSEVDYSGFVPPGPPWWVGTGCTMWINVDLRCGHPLGLDHVIAPK